MNRRDLHHLCLRHDAPVCRVDYVGSTYLRDGKYLNINLNALPCGLLGVVERFAVLLRVIGRNGGLNSSHLLKCDNYERSLVGYVIHVLLKSTTGVN